MSIISQSPYSRLNFDTVRAHARGHWRHILIATGVAEKFLSRRHGPCPCCGGKDRFRFDDRNGNGSFFCNNCGAGDGFSLIQLVRGCSPAEALRLVAGILGISQYIQEPWTDCRQSQPTTPQSQPNKRRQQAIERVWHESVPVTKGDPVWTYLTVTRGLTLNAVPQVLRLHRGLGYWVEAEPNKFELIGKYPCMVAAIVSPAGKLVNVHRTYLTQDGKKALVPKPKKLMAAPADGAIKGAGIKLYDPSVILGVAEGIETALACHIATGIPTWATYSADNMVQLIVPPQMLEVVIFADHDDNGKGQTAARKLARRLLSEGRKIKILLPQTPGVDWCDVVTTMEV